jgi:hypothetical protein
MPGSRRLGAVVRGVARTAVTVGEDQEVDLASGGGPLRQRPADRDLGVVGMPEDGQDGPVAHFAA